VYISLCSLRGTETLSDVVNRLDAMGYEVTSSGYIFRGKNNIIVQITSRYELDEEIDLGDDNDLISCIFVE
jgi:hypothetical protein